MLFTDLPHSFFFSSLYQDLCPRKNFTKNLRLSREICMKWIIRRGLSCSEVRWSFPISMWEHFHIILARNTKCLTWHDHLGALFNTWTLAERSQSAYPRDILCPCPLHLLVCTIHRCHDSGNQHIFWPILTVWEITFFCYFHTLEWVIF